MLPDNTNLTWDPGLDGKFRIIGYHNGFPLIEWVKEEKQKLTIPSELDFISTFYPKDPQNAKLYFHQND